MKLERVFINCKRLINLKAVNNHRIFLNFLRNIYYIDIRGRSSFVWYYVLNVLKSSWSALDLNVWYQFYSADTALRMNWFEDRRNIAKNVLKHINTWFCYFRKENKKKYISINLWKLFGSPSSCLTNFLFPGKVNQFLFDFRHCLRPTGHNY